MVWTDTEWVRQLKQEDEQALQALWELLYRTSLKLTWRYNCSQQDAEDAAARAYHLVLTRGLAQFRYQSKFSTYCHTIIVREMGKVCRHKNRETSIEGDPRLERTLSTPPPIPSANIAAVRARLEQCLRRLNQIEQQVIANLYLVGHTPQQVAEKLKQTRNNVNVIAHRARLKLRQCLVSLGYHTADEALSL